MRNDDNLGDFLRTLPKHQRYPQGSVLNMIGKAQRRARRMHHKPDIRGVVGVSVLSQTLSNLKLSTFHSSPAPIHML